MKRGYTFAKKNTVSFEWKITEVSLYLKEQNKRINNLLEFSELSTGSSIGDRWQMTLWFNNCSQTECLKDHMSIYLHNLCSFPVTAKVTFFILTASQNKVLIKNFEEQFKSRSNKGFDNFIEKTKLLNNLSEFTPDDILTIYVEITVNDDAITIPVYKLNCSLKSQLANDLGKLYDSKDNSDVIIIVGDTKFQAHKVILGARSSVLAAMFTHDMIEKKSNEVYITDIDPEIFEEVLSYIYTDKVTDLDVIAADLLEAANKYQLQSLKEICEEALMRSLSHENLVRILELADRYNAENLKDYAIKCTIADAAEIIETDSFKELENSNPLLALELFKIIAIAKINNEAHKTQTNWS